MHEQIDSGNAAAAAEFAEGGACLRRQGKFNLLKVMACMAISKIGC